LTPEDKQAATMGLALHDRGKFFMRKVCGMKNKRVRSVKINAGAKPLPSA
jgi:hypothetical protein